MSSQIPSVQSYAISLRRVIHLAVLLDNAVEYFNMEEQTDGRMASRGVDIRTGIRKLFQYVQTASAKTWPAVKAEIESDQIQDTMLLIDEVASISNVGDLVEQVKAWKAETLQNR